MGATTININTASENHELSKVVLHLITYVTAVALIYLYLYHMYTLKAQYKEKALDILVYIPGFPFVILFLSCLAWSLHMWNQNSFYMTSNFNQNLVLNYGLLNMNPKFTEKYEIKFSFI